MHPLGVFSWFGYSLPFETRLTLIKQAGFTSTCLWLGSEEDMVPNNLGLTLDNAHAPYQNCNLLWSASRTDVELALSEIKEAVSFCQMHHIPTVVVHLTRGDSPPPMTSLGLSAIRELVRQAEDLGITIAVENTRRPDYLEAVFSNCTSPAIGLCYDSSHDFIAGQSKGELLRRWGQLLKTVHLSDSNQGVTDDHLMPGTGTIDWTVVGKYLVESGYEGTLMLEIDGAATVNTAGVFLHKAYQWLSHFREGLDR
jgi:sugar phosphate isomerase/epimerase